MNRVKILFGKLTWFILFKLLHKRKKEEDYQQEETILKLLQENQDLKNRISQLEAISKGGNLNFMDIINYASTQCTLDSAQLIQLMLFQLLDNPTSLQRELINGITTSFINAQKSPAIVNNQFMPDSHSIVNQGEVKFNTEYGRRE